MAKNVPALTDAMKDENKRVRDGAAEALRKIQALDAKTSTGATTSDERWRCQLTQAIFSVAFAALFALLAWLLWRPGWLFYYYNVPIAVPFAAFVLERVVELRRCRIGAKAIAAVGLDVLVISVAMVRAFYPIPFISGHVLFTAYAVFTGRHTFGRTVAGVVLVQVLFTKIVLWGDNVTMWGALLLSLLCAIGRKQCAPVGERAQPAD